MYLQTLTVGRTRLTCCKPSTHGASIAVGITAETAVECSNIDRHKFYRKLRGEQRILICLLLFEGGSSLSILIPPYRAYRIIDVVFGTVPVASTAGSACFRTTRGALSTKN